MTSAGAVVTAQESYWEKHQIPQVSIGEAAWHLEFLLKGGERQHPRHRGVPCLISDAGVGKTQIVHQLAKKHGYRVVDLRTANFPLLSAGVPQRADETGTFKIAVPATLPRPGERAILFFDEINQGQPHAIAMFFALVEDRVLFNYRLPDETLVVAAMNPGGAQYMVTKLETNPAVSRRLKKFYVCSKFEDWEAHAKTSEFHASDGLSLPCNPWVRMYLATARANLYVQAAKDKGQQFPCPATWQTASLDLYELEKEGEELCGARTEAHLAASIGATFARSLCGFIREAEGRIDPAELLTSYKQRSPVRRRFQAMIRVEGSGVPELTNNLAQYLFEEQPEPQEVAAHLALFMSDLKLEQMQGFYSQLRAASDAEDERGEQGVGRAYMMRLTRELQKEARFNEMNERLQVSFAEYEKELSEEAGKVQDPMA